MSQAHRPHPTVTALGTAFTALALHTCLVSPALAQASSPTATVNETVEIQRLIKEGQHTQALKLIDEALSRNPKDPQMRFRRGVALSMLDRKAEAVTVFQKLVDDHPEMPAPYNNLAVLYGAQGDYEKARGALERAIRTNPAYATAYQNLGDVYAQLASQAYAKALQLDKTDASVPPKLALLRELAVGSSPATVTTPAAGKPVVVAAAATPAPTPPAATAAPVKPMPAPSPSAAAKPTPAPAAPPATPTPTATAPAAAATAEVEAAVKAWASAWSQRDINAYLGAYANDFRGSASSHKSWEQERRDRIVPRKDIKVDISNLKVRINGDKATAQFQQAYRSGALDVSSRKTLELSRTGNGKWLIHQESVGG
jgi:tetratricopeptide (TPR) repeat protein